MGYLGRHQPDFTVPVAPYSPHLLPDVSALIAGLDARMGDPLFRERYRKMQAAWRKEKSRRRPQRRTVTFQLHHDTLALLDKLAIKRDDTKVNVLGKSIQDAWYEHERATKKMKKASDTYKARLKDQRAKHQQEKQAYRRAIEGLLDALAENMDQRCRLEAVLGEYDNAPLEETDKVAHQALVDKRLSALDSPLRDLNLLRFKSKTLRQRLAALAAEDEETAASEGSP